MRRDDTLADIGTASIRVAAVDAIEERYGFTWVHLRGGQQLRTTTPRADILRALDNAVQAVDFE